MELVLYVVCYLFTELSLVNIRFSLVSYESIKHSS